MVALPLRLPRSRRSALVFSTGAPSGLTQLPLASLSDDLSSSRVSFSPISQLPKFCTLDALGLKYLILSVGSFKDLMVFQISPPKRLFSNTKVALESKP